MARLEQAKQVSLNGTRWCMEPAWLMRRRNIAFVFCYVVVVVVVVVVSDKFSVGQNSTRPVFWSILEQAEASTSENESDLSLIFVVNEQKWFLEGFEP